VIGQHKAEVKFDWRQNTLD